MQATVFCKTTAKATQSFFVKVGGRDYFLFQQDFRKSNKEFFRNGVGVHAINNYSGVHSTAVKKTLDKLPSYIRYIEKEYDVAIYEKQKVDGHIRHTIEIVYNFVEAIELPDFDSWDNYNY